jgi:plasmid stabilization system protein ParE
VNPPLKINFTVRASRQVGEAEQWWRENRTKAPDALRVELEQALQLIASQPEVGAKAQNARLTGVRRVLLGRVSYHLYYRLVDSPSRSVQVLALWHTSRGRGPDV